MFESIIFFKQIGGLFYDHDLGKILKLLESFLDLSSITYKSHSD